jgi:aryl-alcohol dehydrogenase-like predicted oxidoreductase
MRLYSTTASRFGDWKQVQELLRTLDMIAKNVRDDGRCVDANISNIAQRYVLDGTPSIASLLIGVRNQDHISENIRTHSFQLNQDEIFTIDKIVAKRRGPVGDVWDLERGIIR